MSSSVVHRGDVWEPTYLQTFTIHLASRLCGTDTLVRRMQSSVGYDDPPRGGIKSPIIRSPRRDSLASPPYKKRGRSGMKMKPQEDGCQSFRLYWRSPLLVQIDPLSTVPTSADDRSPGREVLFVDATFDFVVTSTPDNPQPPRIQVRFGAMTHQNGVEQSGTTTTTDGGAIGCGRYIQSKPLTLSDLRSHMEQIGINLDAKAAANLMAAALQGKERTDDEVTSMHVRPTLRAEEVSSFADQDDGRATTVRLVLQHSDLDEEGEFLIRSDSGIGGRVDGAALFMLVSNLYQHDQLQRQDKTTEGGDENAFLHVLNAWRAKALNTFGRQPEANLAATLENDPSAGPDGRAESVAEVSDNNGSVDEEGESTEEDGEVFDAAHDDNLGALSPVSEVEVVRCEGGNAWTEDDSIDGRGSTSSAYWQLSNLGGSPCLDGSISPVSAGRISPVSDESISYVSDASRSPVATGGSFLHEMEPASSSFEVLAANGNSATKASQGHALNSLVGPEFGIARLGDQSSATSNTEKRTTPSPALDLNDSGDESPNQNIEETSLHDSLTDGTSLSDQQKISNVQRFPRRHVQPSDNLLTKDQADSASYRHPERDKIGERQAEPVLGYKIFCELDGVLVDFDAGVKKLFNGKGADALPNPGTLWSVISRADAFYENLPWTEDGKRLWDAIKDMNPTILTGVPKAKKAVKDKATWCRRELGVDVNHVDMAGKNSAHKMVTGKRMDGVVNVITCWSKNKHHESGERAVLIDDRTFLAQKWEEQGGIFVHHTDAETTLRQLRAPIKYRYLREVSPQQTGQSHIPSLSSAVANLFDTNDDSGETNSAPLVWCRGPNCHRVHRHDSPSLPQV